jgi:hypothetical protein
MQARGTSAERLKQQWQEYFGSNVNRNFVILSGDQSARETASK